MIEKNDAVNNQPKDINPNYIRAGADDKYVTLALGALRLLNNPQNPHTLSDALAAARAQAEAYARWEGSSAPIKHLKVRLSDDRKMSITQSMASGLCGLHIRDAFDPDAVLQVWKEKDNLFEEVLLLCLPLCSVDGDIYRYEKTYPNGQTLFLRIEAHDDGQLDISVDFTATEQAAAGAEIQGWLPVVHVGLGYSIECFLRRTLRAMSRRLTPRPVRAFSRKALLTPFTLKTKYAHSLMLGVLVLTVGLAVMQSGGLNWWVRQESIREMPINEPESPRDAQLAQEPPGVAAVSPKPLATPTPQKRSLTTKRSHDAPWTAPAVRASDIRAIREYPYYPDGGSVAHALDVRTGKKSGYRVNLRSKTGPSSKPLGDMILGLDGIDGTDSTAATEGTADWQDTVEAFVRKVKADQPPMREMGWHVVVVNSTTNILGEVSVEGYPSWHSDIPLAKTDSIYVEEPVAPLLDGISRERMRQGYIALLKNTDYSVQNNRAGVHAVLKLRYESRPGQDEQVHTELYIEGQLVWSTKEGCPAASGLQNGLCVESLRWGQSFRSQRLGEDE